MHKDVIRPSIQKLHAYVPGEQPKERGIIKLNTNENPYPPAPSVLKATREAVDERLRLYPNPTAQPLRERLAKLHGCKPENIIVGNGSDELLAMACRTFVEPLVTGRQFSRHTWKSTVQYFVPSYSLYSVLAAIHGASVLQYPLLSNFALPSRTQLRRSPLFERRAALTFITTPNAPSGRAYEIEHLGEICDLLEGVVVLDEAYVDFAEQNAMRLALEKPNVLVSRTFSKAYSLCFQRVGYFVGHPDLIAGLDKIRDSYNVNGLGQVAALATLDALPYYRANFKKIIKSREWLSDQLRELGFHVYPSQTNFLLVEPPGRDASEWMKKLRQKKILVRWFDHDVVRTCLRISIGTQEETTALVKAVKAILRK